MSALGRRALTSLRANGYSRCRCASKHRTVEAWVKCALADRHVRFGWEGGTSGRFAYHHVCVTTDGAVWNNVDLFPTLEAATACREADRAAHSHGKCSGTCTGLGAVVALGVAT